ncbi:PREDICTED: uncharacterized protein LOC109216599 [Nicotiana attenuata]|uniref:uncharacterized protein LOC109216599 n=1 Tax=Nicotiana attenuata TaxID=49451 RepID=UPI0009053A14|nr:PREDICTED: uncharacterized protein LOC109216599 [Nicotiana attenuata]
MRQMPMIFTVGTPAGITLAFSTIPVAVHEMRIDIVGPLSAGSRKVEAGPYQKIDERKVIDFLLGHIIFQFGIPKEIACDNRPSFIGSKVTNFSQRSKIKRITSSPYHASANGQVESTKKVGDLVLRKVTQNTRKIHTGKLGPTWKGPYRVSAVTGKDHTRWKVKMQSNCPATGT